MSVCGQPSVLYFRRIHPSSKYQSASPSSASFAFTSASVYVFLSDMVIAPPKQWPADDAEKAQMKSDQISCSDLLNLRLLCVNQRADSYSFVTGRSRRAA